MENNLIIGRKPVYEALIANKEIEKIYILFNSKSDIINKIKIEAKKKKIPITELPKNKFEKYGDSNVTQGVVALISSIKYYNLQHLIEYTKNNKPNIMLLLEEIQDTHNLGAILRTCESFGIKSIVITKNNSAVINQTVFKTSAGAVSHLFIHKTHSLQNVIQELKDNGFWIYASTLNEAEDIKKVQKNFPIAIIMGNEEKGVKTSTIKNSDYKIKIPMMSKFDSLNVSVANGIILYEFTRNLD
ncbi:MAG TPA: 23S rRNA (guanosine(2251)-2'-O)-methyltransferase RlmB [Ignavibacteriales bacterium]|jgi:23S rRNA (guanosine2251-2'-O)-methyltransferase|nr:23S rRNA (guanosine(2251)-2'-O)-methyltransferase RlmB [Ignavibacteriales bacterium]